MTKPKTANDTLLCGYAEKQIVYHLRQLSAHRGVREFELDDLRQEMLLALLEKTPVYLKHKSGKRTFIDRTIQQVVRQFYFEKCLHNDIVTMPVDEIAENEQPYFNDTHQGEFSELDRIYLKLDMAGFMKRFTPRQRRICDQLISGYRPKRIARRMHTVVWTIRREIKRIKKILEEYEPGSPGGRMVLPHRCQ